MKPPPFPRPVPRSESDPDFETDYDLYRGFLLASGRTAEEADRKVMEVRARDDLERPARVARARAYQAAHPDRPTYDVRPKSPADIEFVRLGTLYPNMRVTEAVEQIKAMGLSWSVPG